MEKLVSYLLLTYLFLASSSFCFSSNSTSGSNFSERKATRRGSMISYQQLSVNDNSLHNQFAYEKFLENMDLFAKANGWKSTSADLDEEHSEAKTKLLLLNEKLGCKKMIPKGDKCEGSALGDGFDKNIIYTIDISWPSIKQYAEKVIALEKEKRDASMPEQFLTCIRSTDRLKLKDLAGILEIFGNIEESKKNKGGTEITKEQMDTLEKLCVGEKRLFSIEKLDKKYHEGFRKIFRYTLES
ncbi:MAG: hypothetical protein LBB12_01245, partial [Holosporaceae bacterium]|nr:hypothetical protein [Holosporaceae bacterium]